MSDGRQDTIAELESAGCIDTKAAMAVLEDHEDVAGLKRECPYLFKQQPAQVGSTGLRNNGGAPLQVSDLQRRAREAAGTTHLYQ